VPGAVVGRFLNQGQICLSTNRIIVDAKVYDEFVDRFTTHVKGLKVGDPNDPTEGVTRFGSMGQVMSRPPNWHAVK
jgi:acyl-CoA reductase-like NAD-dependent aldehyde dehydrogenase